jgi:hypothetical protein
MEGLDHSRVAERMLQNPAWMISCFEPFAEIKAGPVIYKPHNSVSLFSVLPLKAALPSPKRWMGTTNTDHLLTVLAKPGGPGEELAWRTGRGAGEEGHLSCIVSQPPEDHTA